MRPTRCSQLSSSTLINLATGLSNVGAVLQAARIRAKSGAPEKARLTSDLSATFVEAVLLCELIDRLKM